MSEWISDHQLDEMIIDVVSRTKQQYEILETCPGADACRKLGLELRRGPLPYGTDGLLSGKTIIINQELTWPPRIEFTIFHEITHYLLDEDGQHYEYFTETLRKNESAFRAAIERYSDRGAAEFLMPRHLVRAAILDRGFSVQLIEHLSSTCGASIVASAIQLAVPPLLPRQSNSRPMHPLNATSCCAYTVAGRVASHHKQLCMPSMSPSLGALLIRWRVIPRFRMTTFAIRSGKTM